MNDPKLDELNKLLDEYRVSREGIDNPADIAATLTKIKAGFERKQNQQLLASQIKQSIDNSLKNQLYGLVEPEYISEISKDVQWGLYRVLEGDKASTGYHVIPNTGNEQYKESDLIPGLLASVFETINS